MFDSTTRTVVVVGAQWGDEGKGKLVDVLAERADWVVRYQGGANAGHTVHIGDKSFVLHQIPSGILHPGVRCAIGNGVVLDPETLFEEIDELVADGVDVEGRLYVSDRAHLVMPYHKLVDKASAASKAIGTTGRGIGPAYEDKVARRGVRVLDLRNSERLRELVERAWSTRTRSSSAAAAATCAPRGRDDGAARGARPRCCRWPRTWGCACTAPSRAAPRCCSRARRARCSTSTTARIPS
jgi:adenylosuccinate synthase